MMVFVPKDSPKRSMSSATPTSLSPARAKTVAHGNDPHQLIEGMVIAGRAIGANRGFIYIRGEYRYISISSGSHRRGVPARLLGKNILDSGFDYDLLVHTGAGAYECGEESALMESLEGKRGYRASSRPSLPSSVSTAAHRH